MASACEFPEELVTKPLGYVALTGLDNVHNAMHKSIWDTFTVNRRQDKVLNIQLVPGDVEFPKIKQHRQRVSYEFYVPKGILKTNWLSKHLYKLPALVVVFYDLDWNNSQWKEKQTECASKVAFIRSSLAGRNTRIAVVLIQKNMPLPPGEDPQAMQRAETLCQACELPSKSLFVLPFSDHLHGYVTRLETAFYEICQLHYTNEAKIVKQHKDLLNKSQHQLLFSRHQFKIAFYNELKQDQLSALKHYKQAYQHILEQKLTDINNLEVKLVAGFLNYKICRISFQMNAPLDAIAQFRKHIDYFKSKIGPANLAFEHYAWMAKQFSLFGDLFQEAIKLGLIAIQTQHPGFYYQQAANHSKMRMQRSKALCRFSEQVHPDPLEGLNNLEFYGQRPWRPCCQANEAPDPAMEQAGILSLQALELKVEHFWIIIPLLGSAVAQFREYKSVRMKLFLMVQMGEEYFHAEDFEKTLTLLNRVTTFYRGERWWQLLTSVLSIALRCAYLTVAFKDYITIGLELVGDKCDIDQDAKSRIQKNLLKVIQGVPPEPEPRCSAKSVEKAKDQWAAFYPFEDKDATFTIDTESLASFIQCRACFEADSYFLCQQASATVYLRSVAFLPIQFAEIGVCFNNSAYNSSCVKVSESNDNAEMILKPNEVKKFQFQFVLLSADVHKKLEIKQIHLRLGKHVILKWKGSGLDANVSPSYDLSNYGGERLPVRYNKDGTIAWESLVIAPFVDILPRPSNVLLTITHDKPCLVDEFYCFSVSIDNKENENLTNARLMVKLVSGKEDELPYNALLYLDESDGGDMQSGLNQVRFDLEELQPDSLLTKLIYLRSNEMGEKKVSFEVTYTMLAPVQDTVANIECTCSTEQVLSIETQMPFSVAAKVGNMKFKQINTVHAQEPFTIMTYIKCTSPWSVEIISSEFMLTPDFATADKSIISQVQGLQLKQGDIAGECQCLIAPMNVGKIGMGMTKMLSIGNYVIKWRRLSGGKVVPTKVHLPNTNVDFVPFSIKTELPSHGCVQEGMLCRYTVCNRTSLVQEVEAVIEPSEAFMLAGTTQVQFRILPHGEHTLCYSMYPLYSGEQPLPKLHLNLPHHYNMNSNQLAKEMLTTHIYVKPKPTCVNQEIEVI